jgi:hypothetical protein
MTLVSPLSLSMSSDILDRRSGGVSPPAAA